MAKRFSKIILAMMMAFTTIQSFAYDFAAEKENGKVNALSIGEATITARCGNISNSCEVKAKEYIETDSKIQITCNGETVRNGGCYFSSRFYDWGGGLGMYESGIKVFALKDCELHVSVSNIGDVDLGFCWLNMRLLAKGESTTSSGFCESGSQNDLQIQYTTLDTSADFNAQAKVCVWCDDNVQSAVEFIVTMTNNVIHATGIILECNNIELKCGEKKFIRASVVPEKATDKPIYWSSSNEGIATVDQNGEIMAKSVGDAVITASCGSVSSSCSVTVNPIPATEIAINKNSLTLLIGETETLIATVLPVDATYKTVTWGSSDNNVVSVNTDGTVTAVKVGNAIITATCGTLSETCSVTVNSIEVTGIYLDKSELSLLKGNTATIIATIEPSTATDKTMEWKSYNQNVASVDKDGKITAKSVGIANITATASNGISAACRVEVNEDFKFEVVSKTEKTCRIVSNNKHYSGNVDIPENAAINFELYSVVEIGERVFYNNHDITAISLPTTIKVVGNEAFAQCTKLQSVNIANNINKINNTAFSGCTGLISVQTIEQTQATVTLKANINGENHGIDGYFTEHYGNKILFGINDLTTTIKNLEPNNYYIYSYGLKIGDNYCYVGTNSFTTKDIILNPIYENRTAS